jgi:hypothetical protein
VVYRQCAGERVFSYSLPVKNFVHKFHTDEVFPECESACKFSDVCNFDTTRYDKLKEHLLKIHNKGETPSKKFRLSDYPKSLIPPDDHEILEANEKIQNIIHIENSNIDINQGNEIETKVYIQQPGGEPIPVTLVASKFEIPYQFITVCRRACLFIFFTSEKLCPQISH